VRPTPGNSPSREGVAHPPGRAFVTNQLTITRILDHPGLSAPQAEKPPPPVREVLRVVEHGDGWGVPAQRE
jgi:hypothetical protein